LVGAAVVVALGILVGSAGTFLGAGAILGLPRLAWALVTLATGVPAGRRCPWVRAGGWIFLRAAVRVSAAAGAAAPLILVIFVVLLMMVLLMTVWLILVTRLI
jgi:hypothetical protein